MVTKCFYSEFIAGAKKYIWLILTISFMSPNFSVEAIYKKIYIYGISVYGIYKLYAE